MPTQDQQSSHLAIFKGKNIRRTIHNKEWWFSVIDIIEVLTGTERPRKYWSDLKKKLISEGYVQLSEKIGQLKLMANDGKFYETDCADTETVFRLIQSIPSPKVEPLKRWLAKVGFERIQEIEDPELATKRTKMLYKLKGYPENWIEKRMRGIAIREELTDEWKKRGAKVKQDYEILTAEISKATFDITPKAYKKLKGLKRENLRDHMGDIELVLTMLGESTVTEIHRTKNTQGVPMLREDARVGGQIAGSARKQIEHKLGKSIVSKNNFLKQKNQKELKNKK